MFKKGDKLVPLFDDMKRCKEYGGNQFQYFKKGYPLVTVVQDQEPESLLISISFKALGDKEANGGFDPDYAMHYTAIAEEFGKIAKPTIFIVDKKKLSERPQTVNSLTS